MSFPRQGSRKRGDLPIITPLHFDTVEINNSFYRLPEAATLGGRMPVGPFIYVRFHDNRRLDEWSAWLTEHATSGLDVLAYFNNDVKGQAPRDAMRLRRHLQKRMAA